MLAVILHWGCFREDGRRRIENVVWELIAGDHYITDSTKEFAFYSAIN